MRYDPYGQFTLTVQDGQSASGNSYLFQGRRYDEETGFYYLRNRVMSPVLGRFLHRDPVCASVEIPSLSCSSNSAYVLVLGQPIDYTDASGLGVFFPTLRKCECLQIDGYTRPWRLTAIGVGTVFGGPGGAGAHLAYPLCVFECTVWVQWECPECCDPSGILWSAEVARQEDESRNTYYEVRSPVSIPIGGPPLPIGVDIPLFSHFSRADTSRAAHDCIDRLPAGKPGCADLTTTYVCVEHGLFG